MAERRLSGIVAPAFAGVHRALTEGRCRKLVLKGGRGSGKSTFAAVEGILLLLRHPEMHGVVMRKVARTLRGSVFAQYVWAVEALGLAGKFERTVTPLMLTYQPTGQQILFLGADDVGKLKSIRPGFGYFGYLHLEEFDQFAGEEEVRSVEQSLLRGGGDGFEIVSFNPPRAREHWANRYCTQEQAGRVVHHSNYLAMPKEWLGRRFLEDAAFLCESDYAAYEHEYLGIANSTGGLVFENLLLEAIGDDEIAGFDRTCCGVDWGWYPDPWALVRCHYSAAQRTLYLFDEAVEHKKSNAETAAIARSHGIGEGDLIVCDTAEPKSIEDYRAAGLRARAARKGQGSVEYSMKWLQGLARIVIDPQRCPHAAREFGEYEYQSGRDGQVREGYPDRNNHTIDAVRYATEGIWRRRGE